MVDWIMYGKIQEKKRAGLNKSQTSRCLGIDYKTVLKYWDMTPDDYAQAKEAAGTREKKADKYKEFILECLQKYPDMSAAQIYDWILKEQMWKLWNFRNVLFETM